MTIDLPTTTPEGRLRANDVIHFRRPTTCWGYVRAAGESVTLDAEMIAASIDLRGRSWLDDIDNADARIGRGPWPEGQPTWTRGDPEWEAARETARRLAWAEADPRARAELLAELRETYGDGPSTSRTETQWEPGNHPTERTAAAQLGARIATLAADAPSDARQTPQDRPGRAEG